jgi:RES domain-containing protein
VPDTLPADTLLAWRLVKARHADSAFDGEGARLYGGRWNGVGTRVAYASDSAALAILEVLVHLQASAVLPSYSLVPVEIPAALVHPLAPEALPADWRRSPPSPEVRAVGDRWVRAGTSAVLRVPSAIVETEHNLLLNPAHPDFARLRIGEARPFAFDPRLLGAGEGA